MKSIKVGDETHERLTTLRKGLDTFDDVIKRLFDYREWYLDKMAEDGRARTSVEADRAKDR